MNDVPDEILREIETTFPHTSPDGYRYETLPFKRNVYSIWTVYDRGFNYNGGDPSRCIWGFYDAKKKCYCAPINSTKCGNQVELEDTTPYSAMKVNHNPLMMCFYHD